MQNLRKRKESTSQNTTNNVAMANTRMESHTLRFRRTVFDDMYLIVIDAHSKWPEVINFKKNTKTYRVIEEFSKLFSRFGLPLHVVTDNGPQFRSAEFKSFLDQNGVHLSHTAPYHPATNGAAENFVQTFKDKV